MAQTLSGELAQTYRQIEALMMLTRCLRLRHLTFLPPGEDSSTPWSSALSGLPPAASGISL